MVLLHFKTFEEIPGRDNDKNTTRHINHSGPGRGWLWPVPLPSVAVFCGGGVNSIELRCFGVYGQEIIKSIHLLG